jgi:tetratricopeptide (TPR) repeat protein
MPAAHNNRGNALRGLKRFDEALASLDRAIALRPNYAEAFNNRANVLRDLERFDEALESYERAIALKRDYAEALRNRASLLDDLERRGLTLTRPAGANGPLSVRDYREADRAACLAIFDSNVPNYFAAHERIDFIAFLDDLPGPYLVIEDRGTIVACGGFARHESEPHVITLCWGIVDQGHHKKGLGKMLLVERLRRLIATYAEQDIVVYTSQHTAGFFARHGFETSHILRDHFAPGLDLHRLLICPDAARRLV